MESNNILSDNEKLAGIQSEISKLESKLRNEAYFIIRRRLIELSVKKLDFSLLTNDSDEKGCIDSLEASENHIDINTWNNHCDPISLYPTTVELELDNRLEFRCIKDNDPTYQDDFDSSEFEADDLARIARMLLYYLDNLEKEGIQIEKDGDTAIFRLKKID